MASTPLGLAALSMSAIAPAVCGEAIDVPLNSAYPAGQSYGRHCPAGSCQAGIVETAEPGAMTFGLKPPFSSGPRDENGWSCSSSCASAPYCASHDALLMYEPTEMTPSVSEGSPWLL